MTLRKIKETAVIWPNIYTIHFYDHGFRVDNHAKEPKVSVHFFKAPKKCRSYLPDGTVHTYDNIEEGARMLEMLG